MTKKDLKNLRSKLPRGYGKILEKRTGKHFNSVYLALKGEINSDVIIEAAIDLAKEENERKKALQEKIKKI